MNQTNDNRRQQQDEMEQELRIVYSKIISLHMVNGNPDFALTKDDFALLRWAMGIKEFQNGKY
jgi:hypothetical protein